MKFNPKLFSLVTVLFLAARTFAADTNAPAAAANGGNAVTNAGAPATNASPAVTRDEMANNYLQIQEQLHATQLAIEQNQEAALEASQSNALALAQRLQSLEQQVTQQRANDADTARNYAESARKTQQSMLVMAGTLG